MNDKGFRLYARPSVSEGISRLIDVAATLNVYNYSDTPEQADYRALLSDWEAVGRDILSAIDEFRRAHNGQPAKSPSR